MMLGRDYKAYILTINDHSLELVEQIAGSFAHEYKNFVADTGDATAGLSKDKRTREEMNISATPQQINSYNKYLSSSHRFKD